MSGPTTTIMARKSDRLIRVVLPGIGAVDIETGLTDSAGRPVIRVDVQSDAGRGRLAYGLNPEGIPYAVENGEPGPGVVFLTGEAS
jgi:hypothetical protein